MYTVPVDVVGKIVSPGERHGWFVKVEEQNAGGYLVLEWHDEKTGYDSWMENRNAVDHFFLETGWKIIWSVHS